MNAPATSPETPRAEFQVPTGCVTCGGPLAVRLTPGDAWGCCVQCRHVVRLVVDRGEKGLSMAQPPAGQA